MNKKFKTFRVEIDEKNNVKRSIKMRSLNELPKGDVLIKVKYSSVNYKDALSANGNRGITKTYPHTPGIDASGVVEKSSDKRFEKGDKVLVTGYDLGMNTDGGFSEYIRVPGNWPVKLPENLTLKESMIYGTAGYTAALSIYRLIERIKPSNGDILVTGATGGVATNAISILNKIGYNVVAATSKLEKEKFLKNLGAKKVVNRHKLEISKDKLLASAKFAGAVDTVGGNTLSSALKMLKYDGVATTCGNIGGDTFEASIYPFILKGTHLIGIYSAKSPRDTREKIWNLLAGEWKIDFTKQQINVIAFENLNDTIKSLLNSTHVGRTILKVN
ncbi:MAG: YhdH/YhfP family quinone oxidoreductase [Bacillota bacterium]